jgi:hypothetical protein
MPDIPTSFILTTQQLIADEILADPLFDDVGVISLESKDRESELENRINRIEGIAVAVVIRSANCKSSAVPGAFFSDIVIQIGVCENTRTNKTGKKAEMLAEKLASMLPMFKPANCTGPLVLDEPTLVQIPAQTESDKMKILWAVNFKCAGGVQHTIPQIAPPALVNNAGEITLSCETPGAVIFYRTDGKHPNPRYGAGSSLYTAPFNAAAVTVKARAWLPGYLASEMISTAV